MNNRGIRRIEMEAGEVRYVLTNARGHRMEVSNFGARITALWVSDAQGISRNIVLGLPTMKEYIRHDVYLGASIGRVAGRIGDGRFRLEGRLVETMQNEEKNTLHGGLPAFESALWDSEIDEEALTVRFSLQTPAEENGFPAQLLTEAIYTWTDEDRWIMEYRGRADRTTVFNPTNHVYFNLSGQTERSVADQRLFLAADERFETDEQLIATGEKIAVTNSRYDFSKPQGRTLADCLAEGGLDTPFFLSSAEFGKSAAKEEKDEKEVKVQKGADQKMTVAARLNCDLTGLSLTAYTDQPAVIVYTFNHPDPALCSDAQILTRHGGITLETQQFPNTLQQEPNPAIILRAGECRVSRTVFEISTYNTVSNN